ncbi:hypothetical protein J7M00_08735, partial [bacterium]|nr:hypothetical protein [bacterium]
MRVGIFLFVIALFVFALAVPQQINYQGKVTNSSGVGLNGSYTMVFRLYTVPIGGTALWSETNPSVSVEKGLFDVVLG